MKKFSKLLSILVCLSMLIGFLPIITRAADTVSVSIADYAVANSWENSTQYSTVVMDDVVTVTAAGGSNTGKYYKNGENWRIYQSESGNVTVTADEGYAIVSVKFTYTSSNNGVLTHNGGNIASDETVQINAASAVFSVGNSASGTNGQVRISAIEVVYTDNPGNLGDNDLAPTPPDTLTIEEAIALGASKEHNTYTEEKYYVTGVITEVYNTTYGNMKITDGNGNILTIYGTYDADGTNRYDAMATKPVAGDTVTVYGIIGQYNGTPQIKNGWIVDHIPGENDGGDVIIPDDPEADSTLTIEEALALGTSKEHNVYTEGKYYVTGVITEVYNTTYGNMKITDGNGNILTIYGTYDADGTNRYDAMEVKPVAGDTVTIYGIIGQYNGTPQIKNGWIVDHIPGENDGGDVIIPDDPEADSTLTIEEALALGTSKEHNVYTEGKYYVTGVITEVYNTTYGNMKITDGNGNILTIYGTYDADGTNRYDAMEVKPVAGDTVTIYGIIGQYNGTPQLKNGWIVAHTPAEGSNGSGDGEDIPSNPVNITTGTYVLIDTNGNAPLYFENGWLLAATPTVTDGVVTDTCGAVWTITVTETGVILTDANGVSIAPKGGNNNGISEGEYVWSVVDNGDGTVSFFGQGEDTVTLASNVSSENKYRAYKNATVAGNPDGYITAFVLYPVEDDVILPSDPEANSTLTIEEAIALGSSKEHNVYTTGKYYVTGVITEVYNTTYGNMKITDANGNVLTIYGTYDADGTNRYDAMEVKPVVGDTITVYGVIGQYNGTAQLKNGWIVEHTAHTCANTNNDHKCDICGATISECADATNDHKCDVCGSVLSQCKDDNNDHKCDICASVLSQCKDDNNDHKCDICASVLSQCKDDNNDHKCDICASVLSQCKDDNNDHVCDLCGATVSVCTDANGDNVCDICNAALCTDSHIDADSNHKCDACGATLSECSDNNSDHKCDICGAVLSECNDTNSDHKCDICGAVLSECKDANSDHKCDICGAVLSECNDTNSDHKCDICGAVLSECNDANSDNKCDICGAELSASPDNTLTTGTYVLIDVNGNAPLYVDGTWILAAQPTVVDGVVTDTCGAVWTITVTEGGVIITDANGVSIAPKGGNNNGISEGEYVWSVEQNADGTFSFYGQGDDTVTLASNVSSDNKYRAYKTSTVEGSPDSYPNAFVLYAVTEDSDDNTGDGDDVVVPTDPTPDTTLTIEEAIALGASKEHNTYTEEKYYVTGVITEVYNTTYGNMKITDGNGNILTIYGTYDADGTNRYDAMEVKPVAGDTVTIYGIIGQYNGTPQIKNGWIVDHIPGENDGGDVIIPDDPEADSTLTIEEAIELGASKEHNTYTEEKYYVTGVITEVYNTTYGNMKITDGNGNILTIYGTYDADGTNRYDAMEVKPVAGDTVTIYGIIGQYNGTPQIKNGWIVAHTPGENNDDDDVIIPDDPEADSTLTIEEAIELGASKEHNTYTEEKYYVTGVITEVYNTTYGNMKITDGNGNILTIYGTYDADGTNRYDAMATKPVAGDTVTIYGIIGQYNGTPQIKNGWIVAHTPADSDDDDNTGEVKPPEVVTTLTSGTYVLVDINGNAPLYVDGTWILAAQPTFANGVLTDTCGAVWTITVTDGGVILTDANGVSIAPKGGNNNGISEGEYVWSVVDNGDGTFSFFGQGDDTVTLASNVGFENQYRAYKTSTVEANPDGYPNAFILYAVTEGSDSEDDDNTTGGEDSNEPDDSVETELVADKVTAPSASNAYKMGYYQTNLGQALYFAGKMDGYYLATTTDLSEAVDVYLESVSGGLRLYFMDGGTKTYIDIVLREGYTDKVNVILTTQPTCVYTFDSNYGTFVANVAGLNWYLGTYNTYKTISVSSTSYIEDTSKIGVSQFVMCCYTVKEVPRTGDSISVFVALLAMSAMGVAVVTLKKKEF